MLWQSLLSHSMRLKADIDDTQQSIPLMTPIKSQQIFDMYFDTIFYWYWRGVSNIKNSSAFQQIRTRAVSSQKLSRELWGVPVISYNWTSVGCVVHFTFYKRLWCMGSPCCICLQFLFHGHTSFYYFSYLSTNDHPVFMFNSDPFEVIRKMCITLHGATFTTNFQCRNQITSIAFHE